MTVEMKNLSINGTNFEIVDAKGRSDISELKNDLVNVKSDVDTKANKSELDRTNLYLDALYKLNKGQTYDVLEQESNAYAVDVPSGSKYASVDMVGGKSVVWNQLDNAYKIYNSAYMSANNVNGEYTCEIQQIPSNQFYCTLQSTVKRSYTNGHKYLELFDFYTDKACFASIGTINDGWASRPASVGWNRISLLITSSGRNCYTYRGVDFRSEYSIKIEVGDVVKFKNMQIIDLTQMFGAGNEPATVEEFEAMFPDDYYEYCEPTIISSQIDMVEVKSSNLIYPNMPFIDRSGYTSSGITYTYDENRVVTINGTRAENVTGSLGLFSYGTLDNGKYTLSVYDEYGNYASDVCINSTSTAPHTFIVIDSNRNSLITIVASISGKKYNNVKYYIKLEKGAESTPYNPHIMQQIETAFPVLNSAGSVYDYIDLNEGKLHQRVGVVDMGTLYWLYNASVGHENFNTNISGSYASNNNVVANIISSRFIATSSNGMYDHEVGDKSMGLSTRGTLYVYDSSYTNAEAFTEAMSGVMLYYELAEEIITDIEIPSELSDWLTVEAGGSVTFHNSDEGKRLLIPNKLSFVRKLDEVTV